MMTFPPSPLPFPHADPRSTISIGFLKYCQLRAEQRTLHGAEMRKTQLCDLHRNLQLYQELLVRDGAKQGAFVEFVVGGGI